MRKSLAYGIAASLLAQCSRAGNLCVSFFAVLLATLVAVLRYVERAVHVEQLTVGLDPKHLFLECIDVDRVPFFEAK